MSALTRMVWSSRGGTGKSTVAAGMAQAGARKGLHTVLVDLSSDGAFVHRLCGVTEVDLSRRGIGALLRWAGDAKAAAIASASDVEFFGVEVEPNLLLIPGIDGQGDYFGTAGSPLRRQLLSDPSTIVRALTVLENEYELIVIDTGINYYTALGMAAFQFAAHNLPQSKDSRWLDGQVLLVANGEADAMSLEIEAFNRFRSGPAGKALHLRTLLSALVVNSAVSEIEPTISGNPFIAGSIPFVPGGGVAAVTAAVEFFDRIW